MLISDPVIYNISFEIDKKEDSICHLYSSIELFDGAYFISSTSNFIYDGSFLLEIEKNEFIKADHLIEERPESVMEYDSIFKDNLPLVKDNTTFKWRLSIQTDSDFEVSGKPQFRIYPKSHEEVIDYVISQQSGKLNIYKKGFKDKVPTKIMQIRTGATVKGYTPLGKSGVPKSLVVATKNSKKIGQAYRLPYNNTTLD
ncbi:hypothetical protein N9515_06375 [Vicingaceae bacterium]|nr:hypothetical protein [Vicingaceae bacterium]